MATKGSTTERTTWEDPNAVEVHIVLDDIKPEIWRRLIVPLDTTLAQLHHILQAAMGWTDSHLHEFDIGGLRYGDQDMLNEDRFEDDAQAFDAGEVRLKDFSRKPGTSFTYIYDFGDNWRHTVTLEKLVAITPAQKTAICIAGARSCPPEDVGSTSGYEEFVRILSSTDPDDREEQRQLKRWIGGKFDAERFDVTKTDKKVRAALKKRTRQV